MRRNDPQAKERIAERRRRENEAPRLIDEVRRLRSLQLDVVNGGNQYLWRIVVERAPALFEIPCPEPACTNGGHDITRSVMRALRESAPTFEGEFTCPGAVAAGTCGRILKYVAKATYDEAAEPLPAARRKLGKGPPA